MAVFRIEKTRDYTVMSNYHLRDMSLSLKAKGLLSLMLSLPENWDYTMKGLAHICKDGIDSISGGIRELEVHGYLIRARVRGANGQLGSIEFEPNIHDLNDLGWRYLAQHMDMLLPPELLKAIDPVPFGKYAMQEEQGHFTEHGYISLSGDEWVHERPAEPEKKPSIRERLEQGEKECAEKSKAQPHKEKSAPEL